MKLIFRRIIRYPIKFYSKLRTDKKLRYSLLFSGFVIGVSDYYYRTLYARCLKGVKKLG